MTATRGQLSSRKRMQVLWGRMTARATVFFRGANALWVLFSLSGMACFARRTPRGDHCRVWAHFVRISTSVFPGRYPPRIQIGISPPETDHLPDTAPTPIVTRRDRRLMPGERSVSMGVIAKRGISLYLSAPLWDFFKSAAPARFPPAPTRFISRAIRRFFNRRPAP